MGGYWANTNATFLKEQPRVLSSAQVDRLATFLKDKPSGHLIIKANVSVKDARSFADNIAGALASKTAWTVRVDNALMAAADSGLWVTVRDLNAAPVRAMSIHEGLLSVGLAKVPAYRWDASLGQDEVWLSVGYK
jgi:hypothetical protein